MRSVQTPAGRPFARELLFETFERIERAGDHAKRRRVHGSNLKISVKSAANFGFRQADREHSTRRHILHQPAARGHQSESVLYGKHAACDTPPRIHQCYDRALPADEYPNSSKAAPGAYSIVKMAGCAMIVSTTVSTVPLGICAVPPCLSPFPG